jgi:hypothetical protein
MMLTYDARTQPIRGSGLGHYLRIAKSLCIGWPPLTKLRIYRTCPQAPHPQAIPLREALSAHRKTSTHGRWGAADIDRSTRASNMCTLVCTRCPENLGNLKMGRFSSRRGGEYRPPIGVSSSLARLVSIVFREIRKDTALFAHSNTHNPKSLYGLNRRLPETRRASTPASTSLIPTSSPTGPLSQFAMCTSPNTH